MGDFMTRNFDYETRYRAYTEDKKTKWKRTKKQARMKAESRDWEDFSIESKRKEVDTFWPSLE